MSVWVLIFLDEETKNNTSTVEVFGSAEKAEARFEELLTYMDTTEDENVVKEAWSELLETGSYFEPGSEITYYLLEKEVQ